MATTKRILDEATKKMLQGYVPFSVTATTTYTPEEFKSIKDKSLHPVFTLRSLNQSEMTQLKKNASTYTKDTTSEELNTLAEENMEIVRMCVKSWKNIYDAGTGEEIIFSESEVKDLFKCLPIWIIKNITEFVKKISGLTTADELGLK